MREGDKVTVGGSISTPMGGTSQKIEMRKEKGKFIVSVEGGAKLGPRAANAGATAGGGAKQEFTFNTAEEAEKGIAIIGKMQSGGLRENDTSVGGASPHELEWLRKRATATEVTVNADVGASGEAEKIGLAAGGSGEATVRVEYDQSGKASVVVRAKAQRSTGIEAPWGSFNAEANESLEIEETYELPPGFDASRLKDPAKARAALAELATKSKSKSVKLRYGEDQSAVTFGNGVGKEKKTEVELTPEQAKKVAKAWREQGATGAAKELGNAPVTVTERTYVQGGLSGGVSVNGGGGKVGVTSQRDDTVEVRETTGNREAAKLARNE
jgi:hypothetical protein